MMESALETKSPSYLDPLLSLFVDRCYNVVPSPTEDQLPHFLRHFEIDALATRSGENVAIIVVPLGRPSSNDNLPALAYVVESQVDWELSVTFLDDDGRVVLPPDKHEIESKRQTALRVADTLEGRAVSLLALWSVLEAAFRYQMLGTEPRTIRMSPSIALAKNLISFGFADQQDYPQLADLAGLRDRVAHGFFNTPVQKKDVNDLSAWVDRVMDTPTL